MSFSKYFPVNSQIDISPQRYYGGSSEFKYHPHIKGYFYVFFEMPDLFTNKEEITTLLLSTCKSVSEPAVTSNYAEVPGFGQTKIYVLTNQAVANTLSLTFYEVNGKRVYNTFKHWQSAMQLSAFGLYGKVQMRQNDYKGILTVVEVKPTTQGGRYSLNDIVSSNTYHGVVPTEVPGNDIDISSNDGGEVSASLQFDGSPIPDLNLGLAALHEYDIKIEHIHKNKIKGR